MEDSPFYALFANLTSEFHQKISLAQDLQRRAENAISKEVLPSLRRLKDWVEGTYMGHLRKGPGLASLPNATQGKEVREERFKVFSLGTKLFTSSNNFP